VANLPVLNFEFRSFEFVWYLYFGLWNFNDFYTRSTLFQTIACLSDVILQNPGIRLTLPQVLCIKNYQQLLQIFDNFVKLAHKSDSRVREWIVI